MLTVHIDVHPSLLLLFPSSHPSTPETGMPSPHIVVVQVVVEPGTGSPDGR